MVRPKREEVSERSESQLERSEKELFVERSEDAERSVSRATREEVSPERSENQSSSDETSVLSEARREGTVLRKPRVFPAQSEYMKQHPFERSETHVRSSRD